ncbi:hypothetical protein [Adhaeribacter arboris]|uniref:hypothetical protein n=1 Tax=Adhaeribacter arboris TaxID=2072846 RepID=UPI001304B1CC|nr:hypothetical protein [Adhaeribacter arboris]
MLELLIAALIQVSVLTSGSAPTAPTSTNNPAIKASSAPTVSTNIGTSGWDDRN